MTLELPVDLFDAFQGELREMSAGKLKAEVIESRETVIPVLVNHGDTEPRR